MIRIHRPPKALTYVCFRKWHVTSHRGRRGQACPGGSLLCPEQRSDGASGRDVEHRGGAKWPTSWSGGFLVGPTARTTQTIDRFEQIIHIHSLKSSENLPCRSFKRSSREHSVYHKGDPCHFFLGGESLAVQSLSGGSAGEKN